MTDPIRTCVGCGRKAPQRQLVRFVAPTGLLEIDVGRRKPGRGAYTCARQVCFERAAGRRAFSRTLRRNVTVSGGLNPFSEES
jgi:uncharacterized protein